MVTALMGALVLGQFVPGGSLIRPRPVVREQVAGDAEVLGAINARDANLIEVATLAAEKAGSGEVKSFAAEVLATHQRSLTRGADLAKELQLSRELPPDSAMARMQDEKMDELSLLSGADFDRVFMKYILDAHDAELRKVTGEQMPGAQHDAVKTYVSERLPSLRSHQATASAWLAANPP
jgi:predicted outer membrane protein